MEANHFDALNLLGCPGAQFSASSSLALWSVLDNWFGTDIVDGDAPQPTAGCLACWGGAFYCISKIFYIVAAVLSVTVRVFSLIEFAVYALLTSIGLAACGLAALAAFLLMLPITGPLFFLIKQISKLNPENVLLAAPIFVAGFIACCGLFVIECVWLCLAIPIMLTWPLFVDLQEMSRNEYISYLCRPGLTMMNILEEMGRFVCGDSS
jgi:hypothetical protein